MDTNFDFCGPLLTFERASQEKQYVTMKNVAFRPYDIWFLLLRAVPFAMYHLLASPSLLQASQVFVLDVIGILAQAWFALFSSRRFCEKFRPQYIAALRLHYAILCPLATRVDQLARASSGPFYSGVIIQIWLSLGLPMLAKHFLPVQLIAAGLYAAIVSPRYCSALSSSGSLDTIVHLWHELEASIRVIVLGLTGLTPPINSKPEHYELHKCTAVVNTCIFVTLFWIPAIVLYLADWRARVKFVAQHVTEDERDRKLLLWGGAPLGVVIIVTLILLVLVAVAYWSLVNLFVCSNC